MEIGKEDWLNAPIVYYTNTTPPKNLDTDILAQRRENNCSEVTNAELIAYLSTASLAFPLPKPLYRIYLHEFRKYCEWKNITNLDEITEKITLNKQELVILKKLKKDLRKTQEKQLKNQKKEG